MLGIIEVAGAGVYYFGGYRYVFKQLYAEGLKKKVNEIKKANKEKGVYNASTERWEDREIPTEPEGDWGDLGAALAWSVPWAAIWPAVALTKGGKRGAVVIDQKFDAHALAKTIAGKHNPPLKRLEMELRPLKVKQLEEAVGIPGGHTDTHEDFIAQFDRELKEKGFDDQGNVVATVFR